MLLNFQRGFWPLGSLPMDSEHNFDPSWALETPNLCSGPTPIIFQYFVDFDLSSSFFLLRKRRFHMEAQANPPWGKWSYTDPLNMRFSHQRVENISFYNANCKFSGNPLFHAKPSEIIFIRILRLWYNNTTFLEYHELANGNWLFGRWSMALHSLLLDALHKQLNHMAIWRHWKIRQCNYKLLEAHEPDGTG